MYPTTKPAAVISASKDAALPNCALDIGHKLVELAQHPNEGNRPRCCGGTHQDRRDEQN
jgi:hypothetical protein